MPSFYAHTILFIGSSVQRTVKAANKVRLEEETLQVTEIEQLLDSDAEELRNENLLDLEKEYSDEEQKPFSVSKRLVSSNMLGLRHLKFFFLLTSHHVTAVCSLMEDNDPDMNRSCLILRTSYGSSFLL
ncbi:hypothetical protein CHS0354_038837 [Potamilus streckersoni]|uniref:Uncharacterized protein n=1 Tax=Potamilus streckersoni TaxID=2493646 RepID=A0AAE0WCF1_9BIVA|nr:hypothetical protein CHS0354_038837 [Potamilus streckersoni]